MIEIHSTPADPPPPATLDHLIRERLVAAGFTLAEAQPEDPEDGWWVDERGTAFSFHDAIDRVRDVEGPTVEWPAS